MRFEARGDASRLLANSQADLAGPSVSPVGRLLRFASIGLGAAAAVPLPLKERTTGTVFNGEVDYCAGQRGCPVITGAG